VIFAQAGHAARDAGKAICLQNGLSGPTSCSSPKRVRLRVSSTLRTRSYWEGCGMRHAA